jgi:HSP20 family protein
MASRDFNPLDIFLQLETDILRSAEGALRAVRFQPSVDMYETETALMVKVELAGIRADKLSIILSADDRILTIAGERLEPSIERRDRIRCYHLEIYFGAFEREIILPGNLRFDRDSISANYRDGFLVLSLPKQAENPAGKRVIEVNAD